MATIKLRYVNSFANRKRKNARVRYYFRRRGQKAITLPGLPGSEEFMAAYAEALADQPDTSDIGASGQSQTRAQNDTSSGSPLNGTRHLPNSPL